ncbi:Uncharacterized protein FWK35_00013628, partial [Aphis craccivora]
MNLLILKCYYFLCNVGLDEEFLTFFTFSNHCKNSVHNIAFRCSFMNSELVKKIRNAIVNATIRIGIVIEQTVWEQMRLASIEEKQLGIEAGDIDTDGIPLCPVIVDGQWGKRSYKTKYNALSGAATIIGFRSNTILFVEIRNRYCCICERAHALKLPTKDYKCFLNWDKATTGMEADGIFEGFPRSIEFHSLKFNRLIGDGDSSVLKKLLEIVPYGPHQLVEKIECRNHLLRNYRFQEDISNSPYHIFGQHALCDIYFCKKPADCENHVPAMEKCGLMRDVDSVKKSS